LFIQLDKSDEAHRVDALFLLYTGVIYIR